MVKTSSQHGFTLVELMVVIAIVAVLAALAVPSFVTVTERWRVRSAAESLIDTTYYARSEAVRRGENIVIARRASAGDCTSVTDWSCGWIIFDDVNNDGAQGACDQSATKNECTIRVLDLPPSVNIAIPGNGRLTVDRFGVISGSNSNAVTAALTAKGRALSDASSAQLCITPTGRVRRILGTESC